MFINKDIYYSKIYYYLEIMDKKNPRKIVGLIFAFTKKLLHLKNNRQ